MNKKLELFLVKKYPDIFREYGLPMEKSCMHWGIVTGDGWFHIINNACKDIQKICDEYNIDFVAEQIKEKFGSLRFYYSIKEKYPNKINILDLYLSRKAYKYKLGRYYNSFRDFRKKFYKTPSEKIRDIVRKVEETSCKTCELCGSPATRNITKRYIESLCSDCKKK